MHELIKKHKNRFSRFALVGFASTAIDFSILLTLKTLGWPIIPANITSSAVAFIFSFSANKKYTFKTTDTNIVREITLYVLLTLIGIWGLQSLVIWLTLPSLTHLLGGHNAYGVLASKLVATGVSMVWNYVTYSKFVFHHKQEV